jgi:hypothetical protein
MEDENLHLKLYYLKKDLSMNPLGYTFGNDGKSSHGGQFRNMYEAVFF